MSYYTVSKRTIIALALLLLSTLTATNALAQNRKAASLVGEEAAQEHANGTIEGTVLLQGRQNHSGTYIVVTNEVGPPNSELIVTDANGFFSIDKPDGKYTACGDEDYRDYADINGDCLVDILDESVAGANLGNEGPMYWKTYPPSLSSTPAAVSLRVDSDDK